MENRRLSKRKILLTALILLILVLITAVYVCYRLGVFSHTDKTPSIGLIPTADGLDTQPAETGEQDQPDATAQAPTQAATESTFVAQPGMTVYDDQQIWTTNTQIELFRVSYENGQEKITVLSDDTDALIAPGTDNSYTFRLKNTGNVALNYTVMLEAYYSDNVTYIPVEVRMRDFNGNYCIGSEDSYAPVLELNGLQDHNTLGAGYYAYYTLEWQWPFEAGDDGYDTYLGNLAAEEPVTLTVVIRTLSSLCDDPNFQGGLLPATGDSFQPVLWVSIAVLALVGIILLVAFGWRKRREDD